MHLAKLAWTAFAAVGTSAAVAAADGPVTNPAGGASLRRPAARRGATARPVGATARPVGATARVGGALAWETRPPLRPATTQSGTTVTVAPPSTTTTTSVRVESATSVRVESATTVAVPTTTQAATEAPTTTTTPAATEAPATTPAATEAPATPAASGAPTTTPAAPTAWVPWPERSALGARRAGAEGAGAFGASYGGAAESFEACMATFSGSGWTESLTERFATMTASDLLVPGLAVAEYRAGSTPLATYLDAGVRALDITALGEDTPLLLMHLRQWREEHPREFVFVAYDGEAGSNRLLESMLEGHLVARNWLSGWWFWGHVGQWKLTDLQAQNLTIAPLAPSTNIFSGFSQSTPTVLSADICDHSTTTPPKDATYRLAEPLKRHRQTTQASQLTDEPTEPTEPIDASEPTEPIDASEPTEPTGPTDASAAPDASEASDAAAAPDASEASDAAAASDASEASDAAAASDASEASDAAAVSPRVLSPAFRVSHSCGQRMAHSVGGALRAATKPSNFDMPRLDLQARDDAEFDDLETTDSLRHISDALTADAHDNIDGFRMVIFSPHSPAIFEGYAKAIYEGHCYRAANP